jgi:hypothetical protein
MFGSKRKGPADSPLLHGEDCPTKDAKPEWGYEGNGRWQRVCNCHTEFAYNAATGLDPNSAAAEPSWRSHVHSHHVETQPTAR